MTEEEYKLLTDYLRAHTGLVFTGAQQILFHKRVKKRMDFCKLNTAKEYYHYIKFDTGRGEELRNLIDLLTVNETYFFREQPQMDMTTNDLLPLLKKKKERDKTIRIWSAACSNGAEPYSLAMLIKESGLFDPNWKIEIFGTDINTEILHAARKGTYTESAFRSTPESFRKKYFIQEKPGLWEIKNEIKQMVKFSQMNLYSRMQMRLMSRMDVIYCRNVLIYFDPPGKKEVAEMFYDCLLHEGFLIIGQTESLFKITTLYDMKPMSKVLVYQKPGMNSFSAGT